MPFLLLFLPALQILLRLRPPLSIIPLGRVVDGEGDALPLLLLPLLLHLHLSPLHQVGEGEEEVEQEEEEEQRVLVLYPTEIPPSRGC